MGTSIEKTQWLIRKNSVSNAPGINLCMIQGPFLADQIRTMIQHGDLTADDELCPETGYWIALHEVQEVSRFLKIDPILLQRVLGDTEVTQPDLLANEEETQPELKIESTGVIQFRRAASTSMKSAAAVGFRDHLSTSAPNGQPSVSPVSNSIQVRGDLGTNQIFGFEKGRFWAVLLFACLGLAVLGVIWVIRSLKV